MCGQLDCLLLAHRSDATMEREKYNPTIMTVRSNTDGQVPSHAAPDRWRKDGNLDWNARLGAYFWWLQSADLTSSAPGSCSAFPRLQSMPCPTLGYLTLQ